MARLNATLSRLSGGNIEVFVTLLVTAALVTLIRLFGPLPVSWDLSIQLDAAHRLAQGLGLTNAFSPQLDLSLPPISETLIHFPPGLPLLVAAFLRLGTSTAIALKTIYSLTTVIGWVAWAMVASRCLVNPIRVGTVFIPFNLVISVILPLVYTPSWTIQGTDVFLWAGTPVVTLLLLFVLKSRFCLAATALLGLTIGLLLAFRYASGFLLIAAFVVIGYRFLPKIKSMVISGCIFAAFAGFVVFPILLFNSVAKAQTGANPLGNLLYDHGAKHLGENTDNWLIPSVDLIFSSFSSLYFLTGIDPRKIQDILATNSALNICVGLVFLLLFASLPVVLVRYKRACIDRSRSDDFGLHTPLLLSNLLISFIIFSSALAPVLTYSPLEDERYYYPLKVCLILIAYKLLTLPRFSWLYKQMAKGLVIIFVLFNVLIAPIYYFADYGAMSLAALPFGLDPRENFEIPYPSNIMLSEDRESLKLLAELKAQNPKALFFAQRYTKYMDYLNPDNPVGIRRIPDGEFWEKAYLSRPAKIFWVTDEKECPLICYSRGFFNKDSDKKTISEFESLPDLKTVFVSSNGQTRVMVTDLPAGYEFVRS
ncbi:hypothetical protein IQ265_02790 [Nodosilinea sp. LEGE 06152]|uniref:hypothetical protein n=1 Tax=Nodosilinea sp. LEGE 06152 TaxID=2777966 RepID=UPI00187F2BD2|nr:hypothetical protein [Nodosilinea sp. LEGE 06152]MBE9155762.1 hypothetical protein [Nodosilinea sp. LEGE 06152]